MQISEKDTWFLMQEFQRASYFNWIIQMRTASIGLKDELGTSDSLTVHHEGILELHFNQQGWRRMGERALEKVLADYHWLENAIAEVVKRVEIFLSFLNKVREHDVAKASNEQLIDWLTAHENQRSAIHAYGVIGTILEFDHELFTKYLQNYISAQIEKTASGLSVNKVFGQLTIFHEDTFIRKEEKDMFRILTLVINNPELKDYINTHSNQEILQGLYIHFPSFHQKLMKHYDDYCWIPYQYIGPAFEQDHFVEILRGLVEKGIDPDAELRHFENELIRIKEDQARLTEQLQFDEKHQKLFALARELSFTKSLRNDAYYYSFFCLEPILKEIGKRLQLSLSQVRMFMTGEAQQALARNNDCTGMLNARWQYSVYAVLDGKEAMITGDEARELVEKIKLREPKIFDLKEFTGTTAVVGKATGTVKLILEVDDLPKMNEGDILVSNATYPSLVPAMKKAAAIVTDLGGITSHAAIISRELGTPCIVGTKIATKVLKDGDMVEVDAEKGIVRRIS